MRAVVQRVRQAAVEVEGTLVGRIGTGLLVFVGVMAGDGSQDVRYIADKVRHLRLFDAGEGKMNLAVGEVGGAILLVSQFTLCGDVRKGRRPAFEAAARPEVAQPLFDAVVGCLREAGERVETGVFRAAMQVQLVNDGPVTLIMDSQRTF